MNTSINLFKLIILIFIVFSCKNNDSDSKQIKSEVDSKKNQQLDVNIQENISLEGEWEFIYNPNNDDLPDTMFTLLIQKTINNKFNAQYCAIAQKGNRIDCSNDEELNITGIITGNKINATFYSFFDNKKSKGNVELTILNNESIQWIITKTPNSEYYAPQKCLLTRKKEPVQIENKNNNLPFDFDKYANTNDKSVYEVYSSEQLPEITKIVNNQINEFPVKYFLINNGGLSFQTYILETDGDSITQILINIKDNKIIANEIIGYESDTKNTFTINKDLSINMYKVNDDNSKSITKTLQIKKDGSIIKI